MLTVKSRHTRDEIEDLVIRTLLDQAAEQDKRASTQTPRPSPKK